MTSILVEAISAASLGEAYSFFKRPFLSRQLQRRLAMGARQTLRRRFIRVAVGMEERDFVIVMLKSFFEVDGVIAAFFSAF